MSIPFTVIVPTRVTDANLVSITVPEDDYPVYSAGTTYALEDRVIVGSPYHAVYQSLSGSNTGNFPPTSPTQWLYAGPTNAWAAFDESGGTQLSGVGTEADPLEFVVTGDRINAMGFLGLQASSVRIQAYNPVEGVYYDNTVNLEDSTLVTSWYDYFFAEISRGTEVIVKDIQPISGSEYTISIVDGSGTAKMATFVMGQAVEFGFTEYGAQVGIIDYSRKLVDQFGRASLEKRAFSDRMSVSIELPRGVVDAVKRKLAALRATPCLWVAAQDQFESLTIFGFYRDFNIDISYPSVCYCTAEFEGLS